MNANLPACLAKAFAPQQSIASQAIQANELTEAQRQEIDQAMHNDKLVDGYATREFNRAMELQIQHQDATGWPL